MREPTPPRSHCPINYAVEIFGDRWTLLVLRDLLLMERRHFREFIASDERIASNILTDRLQRLEMNRIISKRPDPEDKRQWIYEPTEKGLKLVPVLMEIAAWSASHDPESSAPDGFTEAFYANREEVLKNYHKVVPR